MHVSIGFAVDVPPTSERVGVEKGVKKCIAASRTRRFRRLLRGGTLVAHFHGRDGTSGFGCQTRFWRRQLSNIVEGTGSGAVFFDYNGDGWLDIYLPNGAWHADVSDTRGRKYRGQLKNRLFRNNRDGTFTDVTDEAGVGDMGFGFGASAADYDGDGHVDLYVLNYGPNVLYRNNGDGTFTDVSRTSGLDNALESGGDLVRFRRRRSVGRLCGELPGVRRGQVSSVLRGFRVPGSAQLQRPTRRLVPQQRRRDVHRRDEGGRGVQSPMAAG
jgi:hypothetical protein